MRRRKHNVAQGLISFVEAIEDPEFDTEELQEYEEESGFDEPTVTPISNSEVEITPAMDFSDSEPEDAGSAITVVTPKGTSVSVTEALGRSFVKSKFYNKSLYESAGSSIFFSNADINAFYNGDSVDDILTRRISKSWNDPQNIKNAFSGSVNEEAEEVDNDEEEPEDEFYGTDSVIEKIESSLEQEDLEDPTPISADLQIEDDKIVLDNIELKDKVEEEPVYDHEEDEKQDKDNDKDSFVIGDPVSEALAEAKKFKDATLTGDKDDVMNSPLKVQTTNGVKNHRRVDSSDEK